MINELVSAAGGAGCLIYPTLGQLCNEEAENLVCPVQLMIFSSELTEDKRFPKGESF